MISMRAMALENAIDDEFNEFAKLRSKFIRQTESIDSGISEYGLTEWWYDEETEEELGEEVRDTLQEMINSIHRLEGYMYTRGVLGG